MSKNALIGWVNQVELGALRAGSETTELPVTNLADDHGSSRWQTAGGDIASWFEIDAGSVAPWRMFGLFRTRLTSTATIRWMLGTAAGAANIYDSGIAAAGVAPGYMQTVYALPADLSARYLRCEISDPGNPDGYLAIGQAFAGSAWQPSRNFSWGWGGGWTDPSAEMTTKGGQDYVTVGAAFRSLDLTFSNLSEAEVYEQVMEMDRLCGVRANILAIPRPDSAYRNREAVFGRIKAAGEARNSALNIWSKQYNVKERL